MVVDDTGMFTKDDITAEGRKLLREPDLLKAELYTITSQEDFQRKTGLHLYVIAGRHTTLAQQERYKEACEKRKPFDQALLKRPTSVYKLSSLGVDGVSCLALIDNKMNEVSARQVDTGMFQNQEITFTKSIYMLKMNCSHLNANLALYIFTLKFFID